MSKFKNIYYTLKNPKKITYRLKKNSEMRKLANNKHDNYKNRIFYFISPNHGNLGDQAIAYASLKFLAD